MSKHLQIFATESAYTAGEHDYPNVSYIEESGGSLVFAQSQPTPPSPIPTDGTWMDAAMDFDSSLLITHIRVPEDHVCDLRLQTVFDVPDLQSEYPEQVVQGKLKTEDDAYRYYMTYGYTWNDVYHELASQQIWSRPEDECVCDGTLQDGYYYFELLYPVNFYIIEHAEYGYDSLPYLEFFVPNE